MIAKHHIAACAMVLTAAVSPAHADSDDAELEKLRQQIDRLERRVAAIESLTSFTTLMPDFAERFHVMHHAGEAGDWAVASHELAEMRRMARLSVQVDDEKGQLLNAMMGPSFKALNGAIERGDVPKFTAALEQTITTCNACHTATGSGFVDVTLDVPDVLSLRHPHRLVPRGVPEGHAHDMPATGGGMAHGAETTGQDHDDTGKPEHEH